MIVVPVDAKGIIPALAAPYAKHIPIATNAPVDPSGLKYVTALRPGTTRSPIWPAPRSGTTSTRQSRQICLIFRAPPVTARRSTARMVSRPGLKKTDPNAKIIAEEDGNWVQLTAQNDARTLIVKYGKQINYFYTEDSTMGAGTAAAIEASGLPIHMVSLTYIKLAEPLLRSGLLLFDVLQSPYTDGDMAAQTMAKILNGQTVPKITYIPTPLVTKANMAQYPAPY